MQYTYRDKISGINRPTINAFGNLMRRITDPLIKAPVEKAVADGMKSVMMPLIRNLDRSIESGASAIAVGAGLGGLISGAATLGGGALLEIFRDRNEQANNDILVDKLMTELRAGQFVNTPQQMLPGSPTISELSNNVF